MFIDNLNFMTESTEAFFISHCDDETCGLGAFQYTCPHCEKTMDDYKIWFKQEDIWCGKPEKFICESCSTPLIVEYNQEENEYWVSFND